MKSARKAWKMLNTTKLLQEIKEKDDRIIMLGGNLDAINHAMINLAKYLEMDNIENLSMFDVIEEVKRRLNNEI